MSWSRLRLNIAGGEPLLYAARVLAIARAARSIGFEVSVITNGSRLTQELATELAPLLCILGVSIDAVETDHNWLIGRVDRRGYRLNLDYLVQAIVKAKMANLNLQLKVNTVVNSINLNSDLSPLIERLQPAKWKVLRVLPVLNEDLAITASQFNGFVKRHQRFAQVLHAEDNTEMMESYIMVDPLGRFYQNALASGTQGHRYSKVIIDVGCEEAFASLPFKSDRYRSRYVPLANKRST